jgi:two-component system alkaline phosphatase synthesis response regulator PhoP
MTSKAKILIVDDDPDIIELLSFHLEKEGFDVTAAHNGKEALEIAENTHFDLIILDVMMPEVDGVEVCRELREKEAYKNSLIVFLTARSEDYSQIAGLEAGADDYIAKPIKPRVFITKVKSLLRRKPSENTTQETHMPIVIDKERYVVIKEGKELILPRKEFELLALLMSKPGKVFDRNTILEQVWGTDVVIGDRTIDVHIRKLREKIGSNYIKTLKGVGYKFEIPQ